MNTNNVPCTSCRFLLYYENIGHNCSIKGCYDYNKYKEFSVENFIEKVSKNKHNKLSKEENIERER